MLKTCPYNHAYFENCFSKYKQNKIQKYFNTIKDEDCKKYTNINDTYINEYTWIYNLKNPIVNEVINYFYNHNFIKQLENIFNIKGLIVDMNFWGGGYMNVPKNYQVSSHIDYTINGYLNLERKLTGIYFLETYPKKENNLFLHNENKEIIKYSCKKGDFVIFENTNNSWHGIEKCINKPMKCLRFIYYVNNNYVEPKKSIYYDK
jgi:hypothetical protein